MGEKIKPQEEAPESASYRLKWSEMGLWITDTATGRKDLAGEAGNSNYSSEQQVHFLRDIVDGQDKVLILSQSQPSPREKENSVPANSPIELSSSPDAKVLKLQDFCPWVLSMIIGFYMMPRCWLNLTSLVKISP